MNTANETNSEPLRVPLSDLLGSAVNSALFADDCQRLAEWALIGPVQRAALERFAERLLAAERERCARLVWDTPQDEDEYMGLRESIAREIRRA